MGIKCTSDSKKKNVNYLNVAKMDKDININKDLNVKKINNSGSSGSTVCTTGKSGDNIICVNKQERQNNSNCGNNSNIIITGGIETPKSGQSKIGDDVNINIDYYSGWGETEYPIYIPKNTQITIIINDADNKVLSFNQYSPKITYLGDASEQYNNMNLGCLCLGVSTSPTIHKFTSNKLVFTSGEHDGSWLLFMNLKIIDRSIYHFAGRWHLTIIGGISKSFHEIDILTGYKNITNTYDNPASSIMPIHMEIIRNINKMRTNPEWYFNHYFSRFTGKDYVELKELIHSLTPWPELKYDANLTKAADDHREDICLNGMNGHISSTGLNLKQRIEKYCTDITYFGENCWFGLNNPILITADMLINNHLKEKSNRNNWWNPNYARIGVSVGQHICFRYGCVVVFGKKPLE